MGIERRMYPRIDTIELVSYENYETTKTELMQGMGKTVDLSLGGVCFESTHALPLGSEIKLSFALGDSVVETSGQIVSLNLTSDLHVMIHVRFGELPDSDRQILSDYLEEHKGDEEAA